MKPVGVLGGAGGVELLEVELLSSELRANLQAELEREAAAAVGHAKHAQEANSPWPTSEQPLAGRVQTETGRLGCWAACRHVRGGSQMAYRTHPVQVTSNSEHGR